MYTASIALTRAWLTLVADPSAPLVCGTRRPSEWAEAQDGGVWQYAGGRRQGVAGPSKLLTGPLTFVGLSFADFIRLRSWSGKLLLLRRTSGEKIYCQFNSSSWTGALFASLNDGRTFDVTLTLYQLDFDESV